MGVVRAGICVGRFYRMGKYLISYLKLSGGDKLAPNPKHTVILYLYIIILHCNSPIECKKRRSGSNQGLSISKYDWGPLNCANRVEKSYADGFIY